MERHNGSRQVYEGKRSNVAKVHKRASIVYCRNEGMRNFRSFSEEISKMKNPRIYEGVKRIKIVYKILNT